MKGEKLIAAAVTITNGIFHKITRRYLDTCFIINMLIIKRDVSMLSIINLVNVVYVRRRSDRDEPLRTTDY